MAWRRVHQEQLPPRCRARGASGLAVRPAAAWGASPTVERLLEHARRRGGTVERGRPCAARARRGRRVPHRGAAGASSGPGWHGGRLVIGVGVGSGGGGVVSVCACVCVRARARVPCFPCATPAHGCGGPGLSRWTSPCTPWGEMGAAPWRAVARQGGVLARCAGAAGAARTSALPLADSSDSWSRRARADNGSPAADIGRGLKEIWPPRPAWPLLESARL